MQKYANFVKINNSSSLNYKLPYQNNLILSHGDLLANESSVIYLQNETKINHVAHNMAKLFEFSQCIVLFA